MRADCAGYRYERRTEQRRYIYIYSIYDMLNMLLDINEMVDASFINYRTRRCAS